VIWVPRTEDRGAEDGGREDRRGVARFGEGEKKPYFKRRENRNPPPSGTSSADRGERNPDLQDGGERGNGPFRIGGKRGKPGTLANCAQRDRTTSWRLCSHTRRNTWPLISVAETGEKMLRRDFRGSIYLAGCQSLGETGRP